MKTSRSFVDSSTIGRVLLGTNDKRGTHERHNLGIAAARLHPSWAGDPLFPTLPLLTSSDVAVLTLAKPVTYSKAPATATPGRKAGWSLELNQFFNFLQVVVMQCRC